MKLIKRIFLFNLLLVMSCASSAQKQTFDVITYSVPKGWQQQQNEGGVQLSVADKKSGGYAIAIIIKATTSTLSANENFTNEWNRLIKNSVQVNAEPTMEQPASENGWDIISGGANYTDGGNTGMATLLTATGGGQTTAVVLMTNTSKFQNDISAFLNSLALSKAARNEADNTTFGTKNNANNNTVAGLWTDYTTESSGYVNGFPQVTGGYTRREYNLKTDGTYIFRHKYWGAYMKEILFVYETGTWKVNGNQLTITPKSGRGGWWNKAASGRTSEWGSLKKASGYTPEAVTYSFEFKYLKGMQETYLILRSDRHASRDGTTAETNNYEESFSPRALDKSLIDNPPGF